MSILFMGNNLLAARVAAWLREEGETIAGLVLHPPNRRAFGEEIMTAAGVAEERCFDASELHEPATMANIQRLQPDIGVSVLFGYILRAPFLSLFPAGCINLHPSLLPFNRGAFPNVWSIVEGTPAGATLHYIDVGIDTGDIIWQEEVPVAPVDTGKTLYQKLEEASLRVFQRGWRALESGAAPRRAQSPGTGTFHRTTDVAAIDEIDLDATYTARHLINVLRARTFSPHKGAYFMHDGRKVYMQLDLQYE